MRSNKVRALVVALAASAFALVVASSAFGVSDLNPTVRSIVAGDNSLTIAVTTAPGENGIIHGNFNYWTSPIDPSGTFQWFNKSVEITDFAFPDLGAGNGVPVFQTATFGRNIGAGYSAPAALSGPPFSLSNDGVYSIVATGTGTLGDARGEITPAFGIDQTKPVVTTNALPFYAAAPTVTLIATDAASGIENVIVGVGTALDVSYEPRLTDPGNFSVDIPFLGSGMHTFSWTAFDNAGNVSNGSATFTVDNTAPTTTSDAVAIYNGAAVIHLTGTDNAGGSGVAHTYYILDAAPQVEGTTVNVPAPVNGSTPHTLEFWSVDAVGNIETPHVTTSFTVNSQHTITATQAAHGSVTPAGSATVNLGANATYAITPDAGYHVASVLVDGVSVGAVTSYTFLNVTAAHTISATFAVNTYAITATQAAHGSVTPAGAAMVNLGANAIYAITPDAGYHVAGVLVDGVSVGAVTSYTFLNVTAAHTISATFAVNTYTITAMQAAHGSVTPTGAAMVNLGANATYAITPDTGYHVASVLVDGVSVGAVTSYMFPNVAADHTISATFAVNVKTVSRTSINTSATSIRYGRTVRLFGFVVPNAHGQRVTIQRYLGAGRWANFTTATLLSNSSYTRTISKMRRGNWYFRTVYSGTSTVAASTSRYVKVVVR